jgi:hypothetical protein
VEGGGGGTTRLLGKVAVGELGLPDTSDQEATTWTKLKSVWELAPLVSVGRQWRVAAEMVRFARGGGCVSAIKPYEGFGDVDHTIKELMSL